MMKVYEGKGGTYVIFSRIKLGWEVILRTGAGEVADKVICDDYRDAVQYRKAFLKTARS